jgi:hypothetical protein
MPSQNFNRVFATARVLESVCEGCLKTVGVSTTPQVLSIAERAHICPAQPARGQAKAAASS